MELNSKCTRQPHFPKLTQHLMRLEPSPQAA